MLQKLHGVKARFEESLASVCDLAGLEELRVQFAGKKGELTEILRSMGSLAPEDRPKMGQKVNELRNLIEEAIANKKEELSALARQAQLASEAIDVTIPAEKLEAGTLHPHR